MTAEQLTNPAPPDGINLDGVTVLPVVGSNAEPYLSHGQPIVAAPTARVRGENLYVYYDFAQDAHLVAWMDRSGERLTVQTGTRSTTYRPTDRPDQWRQTGSTTTERFRIVGRVVGALQRVGKRRAQSREAARMIANA
jgi:hypothetical protein